MWAFTTLITAGALFVPLLQSANPPFGHRDSSQGESNQTGQTSSASGANAKDSGSPGPVVGAQQAVITVHGVCRERERKSAGDATCATVISREQFEDLMNALNPEGQSISPRARQNLAKAYADFLAFEEAANEAGLEKSPEFQRVMNWTRLRTIADLYRRNLQEKYRNPSQEEIDAYYHQHLSEFDRVKLVRILVPRDISAPGNKEFEQKALQAATAARDRAAKGEDPAQIQKDVYATLGLASPPPTDLGNYGRANFVEKEGVDVFALKPGEVSQVEIEPKSYVVYKVVDKKTLTEDEVKNEISRAISEQNLKNAVKLVTNSARAEFNEQYFGPGMVMPENLPSKPATPPPH